MFRVAGSVVMLFGLILSLIFSAFLNINISPTFILMITIWLLWLVLSVLLKLEVEFVIDHLKIFAFSSVLYTLGIVTFLMVYNYLYLSDLVLIINVITSNLSLILSWHFSLSIYKKKKIVFVGGFIGYLLLVFYPNYVDLIPKFGILIALLPNLFVILGCLLILITEVCMKKKGYLNYI